MSPIFFTAGKSYQQVSIFITLMPDVQKELMKSRAVSV